MIIKRNSIILAIAFLAFFMFNSCKKITIPDPSLKELFRKWEFKKGTSGWGGSLWPEDKSIWIEFKENGYFKKHEKGKLTESKRFTFKEESSNPGRYIIDYKGKNEMDQIFEISGDTLILMDNAFDAGTYICVKK
ncbi:MAG: hypothetical protein WCK02_13565 [Bacteroidota bacterium]